MNSDNLIGRNLGHYAVMERLGRGGMADVYKAFHPQLEMYRAIKVIRREFVTAPDFRARFQKEAQAVATLRHPNIVQIHDFGEQDEAYYMVMEFIQGRDLKRIIQEEGRVRPISRALDIVDQVAGALHYAHSQGLIHRDIKPENIMISDEGLPILMDFGIAKLLTSSTQLTQTGLGIGTPAYMPPEQAKALPDIGPPTDIYSLSVVLYEMLTGRVPYSADTPMAVMLKAINDPMPLPRTFSSDISESLQQVLLKGLAKEANDRYATAKQFQEALHRAAEDDPLPAATEIIDAEPAPALGRREATTPESREAAGPRRYGLYGLVAALLVAAVGIGLYIVLGSAPGGETRPAGQQPATAERRTENPVESAARETKPAENPVKPAASETRPAKNPARPKAAAETAAPTGATVEARAKSQGSIKLLDEQTTTAPGKALKFPVTLKDGDVVYLQVYKTSATTDFTLTSPDGRNQVFRETSSHGPVTLDAGGEYTFSALTRGDKTASVDFVLWLLKPPVIDGGTLQLGQYTKGHTSVAGQKVSYNFDAKAGETVFFDLAKDNVTTYFTLLAPDGRTRVFQDHDDHGPVALDRSGNYTLIADPGGDDTSKFEFTVWNVDPPVVDGGRLKFGRYTEGRTSVAGQKVSYTFEAKAGQTVTFDLDKDNATTYFTVVAPDGRTKIFTDNNDHGPVTLKRAGTYALVADPAGDETTKFAFTLRSKGASRAKDERKDQYSTY